MKKVFITFFACIISVCLYAQGHLAGVCTMYEKPKEEKLSVPKGYEPWIISHYGRHGARFLTSENLYNSVYEAFEWEKENLTEYGEIVYNRLLSIQNKFDGKAGALTQKGVKQHQQIAKRMKKRFRSIFSVRPNITAVSSTTPRCILSMKAFCGVIGKNIKMRSDSADLYIMNPHTFEKNEYNEKAWWRPFANAYCDSIINTSDFEKRLFKTAYSYSSLSLSAFELRLFNIIQNLECLDFIAPSFDGLFSDEEKELLWEKDNINCFFQAAAGFPGRDRQYAICYPLLEDIIQTIDNDLLLSKPSVRLRFGHDMTLNGLLTLMGIEGWNKKANSFGDIKNVSQNWRMPMAGNIQIIVYTKANFPALVRFYLHEKAIELPLQSVADRLYLWSDFRQYYLEKVEQAIKIQTSSSELTEQNSHLTIYPFLSDYE